MEKNGVIAFDKFEIDHARGEIRRDGTPLAIEPQVFDLIAYFAARPGEIVSHDDLIANVWNGRIVSDSTISSRINAARSALGDDGTAQKFIRTIPRRGFRFEGDTQAGCATGAGSVRRSKPSVAVLPFQNLSGDPEQVYFSDGITDDIITELSRFDELFVIARHSSFAYRDGNTDASQITKDLGVQYLVEGSVRRAGSHIRVSAQLVDPEANTTLWAERYDRSVEDIFEVQDDITAVVVNTLVGEIERAHHKRSLTKSRELVDAYDHYLRAADLNWRMGPDDVKAARAEARLALEIDPGFSRAHALVAWTYISETSNAWAEDPSEALKIALKFALAAVNADDREPLSHAVLGWCHIWSDRDFDRGLAEHRRAIALLPGSAHYRSLYAFSLSYSGRSEQAIEELENAMKLNPHYPELYHVFLGRALFNLRRYDEAIKHLERIRTSMPGNANAVAHAAACYAALGKTNQARSAAAEVLHASPRFSVSHARAFIPYAVEAELENFLDNLALAGLPE